MHILFLSDNFPPESNAPANRTYEHARHWVESGHQVTVVTGAPNFPLGKVYSGYRNQWCRVENMSGIRVVRVKTFISANEGFFLRTLDYISFMISGAIVAVFQKKPDVVVATSPQFFNAIGGWITSLIRRKPFVLEIRDMWPSSIVAVGAMKDSVFIKLMERVEHFLYRRARAIVVVTHSFKKEMIERGIDPAKIHVVLNGVDQSTFFPREKDSVLIDQYALNDKFVVGYIGTHGMAHDLENVLKAVSILRENAAIQFIFAGAGAMRDRVEEIVQQDGLSSVTLISQQRREAVPGLIALCDICLVPLRNSPVFAGVIPSKIFECQAMGVPVLMSLPPGEATELVTQYDFGEIVPPESPEAMAMAIEKLYKNSNTTERYSKNALKAADEFSRNKMAASMLQHLQGVVN